MKQVKYILAAVLCLLTTGAFAQTSRITGNVSDDMGPLMMVNVVELNKDNRIVEAATTDFDGNFVMAENAERDPVIKQKFYERFGDTYFYFYFFIRDVKSY